MEDDAKSEEWTILSAEVEDVHIANLNQNDTTPVAVGTGTALLQQDRVQMNVPLTNN